MRSPLVCSAKGSGQWHKNATLLQAKVGVGDDGYTTRMEKIGDGRGHDTVGCLVQRNDATTPDDRPYVLITLGLGGPMHASLCGPRIRWGQMAWCIGCHIDDNDLAMLDGEVWSWGPSHTGCSLFPHSSFNFSIYFETMPCKRWWWEVHVVSCVQLFRHLTQVMLPTAKTGDRSMLLPELWLDNGGFERWDPNEVIGLRLSELRDWVETTINLYTIC